MKFIGKIISWILSLFKKKPDPEPEPQPEYIWLDICTVSGKVAQQWCKWHYHTTLPMRYIKGEEPKAKCDVHTKPWSGQVCVISQEKPKRLCLHREFAKMDQAPGWCHVHNEPNFPEPIPDYHGQFLGFWSWFRNEAWDPKCQRDIEEAALQTAIKSRMYGMSEIDGFLWLCDGKASHNALSWKAPWVWFEKDGKRVFDLDRHEPRFFELYDRMLVILQAAGQDFGPHGTMRPGYCKYPFENNVNGIRGFNDPKAVEYQVKLTRKICELHKARYGASHKVWWKPYNEPNHGGKVKAYHEIMKFHQRIWEEALIDYTDLRHVVVDMTLCEGGIGELREYHACSKPGPYCFGNGWHGKNEYDRLAVQERHGFSTKTDFVNAFSSAKNFLRSQNKVAKYTEDAGGQAMDGLGVEFGPWKWGNAEQQYEMAKYLWEQAERYNKRIIYGTFSVETLTMKNGMYWPDYRVENIDWSRPEAIQRAWHEVYG